MVNKNYESDLLAQINHQQEQRNLAAQEEQLEYEDGLKTEALYQERLKQVEHLFFSLQRYLMSLEGPVISGRRLEFKTNKNVRTATEVFLFLIV